jgi:hypothetical protein
MGTGSRRPWTREELLLALHLYARIEFGKQHRTNPDVVALARVLGRTPGSVAMKLNNFTSLDPDERERGVRGLAGASRMDRRIWQEFHGSAECVGEAEGLWRQVVRGRVGPSAGVSEPGAPFRGTATEATSRTRVRRAQAYFRRMILSIYESRCCITGIPVRSLLTASHIVPWAVDEANRVNPRNGLCLARTQDAAFDRGLVTLDADLRLVVGTRLRGLYGQPAISSNFKAYEGRRIRNPVKSLPDPKLLEWHRGNRFKG